MNEIEEYLLMIFLEDFRYLDEYTHELAQTHGTLANFEWKKFKQEELGRTIPGEYEYFASDYAVMCMRAHEVIDIHLTKKPLDRWKNKIKITVVKL